MKKSILFGALAFFAVSAMGIQDANAQNEVKVNAKKAETVSQKQEKTTTTAVSQEPVKKKDDCCADKKTDQKKGDCCADKKVKEKKESKDCCADKKVAADQKKTDDCCADKKVKSGEKQLKTDGKKDQQNAVKPASKKAKKSKIKQSKADK